MGSQLSLRQQLYPSFIDLEYSFFSVFGISCHIFFIIPFSLFHSYWRVFFFFFCCKTRKILVCEGQSRGGADYSEGECCGQRPTFSEKNNYKNKKK